MQKIRTMAKICRTLAHGSSGDHALFSRRRPERRHLRRTKATIMNDKQVPIGSGFGAHTTADEVLAGLDLSGKRAIVTGGHSGLGLETTRALAGAGAKVTIGARNIEVARSAVAG